MSIDAITYNEDLSGVEIELSSSTPYRVVLERSINQMLWETVRGGVSIPVDSESHIVTDYEFASDQENFYRTKPVNGPGLVLDGELEDYSSTPHAIDLHMVGNIDIRADITPDRWSGEVQAIAGKYNTAGDQRSYLFWITSNGHLRFIWSEDGTSDTTGRTSSVPVPPVDGMRLAVRVTLTVSSGAVRFYTATSMDGPWSQLGATQTAGATSTASTNAPFEVGSHSLGTQRMFKGVIHHVQLRSGINGTIRANPIFENQPHATGTFQDSTGKTWTVHGDAIIGNEITDSITPSLAGEVWLKSIRYPMLNQIVEFQDYGDVGIHGDPSLNRVAGRSLPVGSIGVSNDMLIPITLNTEDENDVRKLMVSLAVGDIFFLHVPPNEHPALPPKSFYFVRANMRIERWQDHLERRLQHFDAQEVAAPGPGYVGTLLTWATIFRLYGDHTQLINANPSWAPLLQTVGDPEDLVVL